MNMKTEADGYRLNNNKMDGFVLFNKEGKICGWCEGLHNGTIFKPEIRAVGVNGDEYISWGGNDQNGAEGWKQVMKPKGRPKKEDAMSNAEKQKAYRDRQRTMQYQMLVNPPIDKQLEAEATLNKKLAQSTAEQNTRLVKEKAILKTEFDALANKLAMTERALLSSLGEVKRLYEQIEELQREVVKLSKKPKKGFL